MGIAVFSIGWDMHQAGLRDSVAADAFVTLAERLTDDSEQLPRLMRAKFEEIEKWHGDANAIAGNWLSPTAGDAERMLADFDENAGWAIELASRRTGISAAYLINTAHLEANFDPEAQSNTSSAAGLFQMTAPTWLSLLKDYGARYGWKAYGDHVACTERGCDIADATVKRDALALRFDVMTSTFLAAELTRQNQEALSKALSRDISDSELYLAHFLGPAGAARLLKTLEGNPGASAASMFPAAARANGSLFYNSAGRELTARQFCDRMDERWQNSVRKLNAVAEINNNEAAS